MTTSSGGPAQPTAHGQVAFCPAAATITDGFWSVRQRVNGEVTMALGAERLRESGALANFSIAAGAGSGTHRGKVFADSDVYKWLEATAWESGRAALPPQVAAARREAEKLVAAAQCADGYVNTYVQITGGKRYSHLVASHELYCAGHLIQAAVAGFRSTGDRSLLDIAGRFADHIVATFGPDRLDAIDGHPQIETALAELYRATGKPAYLTAVGYFVDARGHGKLPLHGHHGPGYLQDRVPVRTAASVEGHAVRALYLAAGATDLATETGDSGLLGTLDRQWRDMVATKTYLTGGMGSSWYGEAFGGPHDLPPDTAYCETCAAIASVHWSWRMLLATGEPRFADLMERTLYNAVLPGVSLDGRRFFYANTLRLRAGADADDQRAPARGRQDWYGTACCPPNIMRLFASLQHYMATADAGGVQVHQYAPGTVSAGTGGDAFRADVRTGYPWDGIVHFTVREAPDRPFSLAVRIPAWAGQARAGVPDATDAAPPGTYHRVTRVWRPGQEFVLDLGIRPRLTVADPRIDALTGRVAVERGPLVYCAEQVDQAPGVCVDDLCLAGPDLRDGKFRGELLGGVVTVKATGRAHVYAEDAAYPYRTWPSVSGLSGHGDGPSGHGDGRTDVTFVPYYAWANRTVGPMTVWLPMHQ